MEITKVTDTYTNYVDIRQGKLVLVQRRISEGYYECTHVVDTIVGNLLDIIV